MSLIVVICSELVQLLLHLPPGQSNQGSGYQIYVSTDATFNVGSMFLVGFGSQHPAVRTSQYTYMYIVQVLQLKLEI